MVRSGAVEIPAPGGARVVLEWAHDFALDAWHARIVEKNENWHREMSLPVGWPAEDIATRVCGSDLPGGRCDPQDVADAYAAFRAAAGHDGQELSADGGTE